jgi:hypothetical protein
VIVAERQAQQLLAGGLALARPVAPNLRDSMRPDLSHSVVEPLAGFRLVHRAEHRGEVLEKALDPQQRLEDGSLSI